MVSTVSANAYSLKDIIQFALSNAPTFLASKNELLISKNEKSQAMAKFFPSLDLEANHNYLGHQSATHDNRWADELKLSLTSELYNNGSNYLKYDQKSYSYRQQQIKLEQLRSELCLNTAKEYYNFAVNFQSLKIEQFQYKLLSRQFFSIKNQYLQGLKTRIDYVRFKAKMQRAKLSLQNAQTGLEISKSKIKQLIGWNHNKGTLDLALDKVNASIADTNNIDLDLKQHFVYRINEYQKKINDVDVKLTQREYWPRIYLQAYATHTQNDYLGRSSETDNTSQNAWGGSLNIKFNLWDWGIRNKELQNSRLNNRVKLYGLSQTLLDLKQVFTSLILNIKQEQSNFKLNQELVDLERKNYSELEQNYRRGQNSFLDLVNGLDNFTSSQQSYYSSYYKLKSLMAELKHHQGILYEEINNL